MNGFVLARHAGPLGGACSSLHRLGSYLCNDYGMTKGRIGLQLYSLRDEVIADLEGTLRRVAETGFEGVEPFGLTPDMAARTRQLCNELGLAVPSVHVAMPEGANRQQVLGVIEHLQPERVVCTLGTGEFATRELVEDTCRRLNAVNESVVAMGLQFGVHNHCWEFQVVDGVAPYQVMLEQLQPEVFFELDVYWIAAAGVDPASVLPEFGTRVPLLHLKDGPAKIGQPMVALGTGFLDIPGIVEANATNTEWLIVELDECETDMFEALKNSFNYLTGVRRAVGNG